MLHVADSCLHKGIVELFQNKFPKRSWWFLCKFVIAILGTALFDLLISQSTRYICHIKVLQHLLGGFSPGVFRHTVSTQ